MNTEIKVKHHLSDQLLMAYAAGALPEAFNLIVATHIQMCDQCRAASEAYDAVGGVLLNDMSKVSMSKNALDETMALISNSPEICKTKPNGDVPHPLAAYIGSSLSDVKWKPVGMGVRQSVL